VPEGFWRRYFARERRSEPLKEHNSPIKALRSRPLDQARCGRRNSL